jgi:CBS domain-containing protein
MLTTLQVMADKKTGFLVVLDRGSLVGVVSERDFVGRVALAKKSPEQHRWRTSWFATLSPSICQHSATSAADAATEYSLSACH